MRVALLLGQRNEGNYFFSILREVIVDKYFSKIKFYETLIYFGSCSEFLPASTRAESSLVTLQ